MNNYALWHANTQDIAIPVERAKTHLLPLYCWADLNNLRNNRIHIRTDGSFVYTERVANRVNITIYTSLFAEANLELYYANMMHAAKVFKDMMIR